MVVNLKIDTYLAPKCKVLRLMEQAPESFTHPALFLEYDIMESTLQRYHLSLISVLILFFCLFLDKTNLKTVPK
jgi:hypothetical protein